MTSVVFYFQVHQPYRLRRVSFFDVGSGKPLFDDAENERLLRRVAARGYLPANKILLEQIEATEGRFRCAFSLSGTVLEQLEKWDPETLQSFRDLVDTGSVELLCETSHHSLASQADPAEWRAQIVDQQNRLLRLFGVRPVAFRNTELVIDATVAKTLDELGFEVLLGEGADDLLNGRSAHQVWRPAGCKQLQLLLRAYPLSDDIAFRFSNPDWPEYPLLADAYAAKLEREGAGEPFVGLFLDYETFGEHQVAETGILDFLEYLPRYVLEQPGLDFKTPSEVAREHEPAGELALDRPFSWADAERDLSAWLGNPMQRSAHAELYELGAAARRAAAIGQPELLVEWRRLTTSDHVYYMCTKKDASGEVHDYFSPYGTPHDAYITFMNALEDLRLRLEEATPQDEGLPERELRPSPPSKGARSRRP